MFLSDSKMIKSLAFFYVVIDYMDGQMVASSSHDFVLVTS